MTPLLQQSAWTLYWMPNESRRIMTFRLMLNQFPEILMKYQ